MTFHLRIRKTKYSKSIWYDVISDIYILDHLQIFTKFFLLFTCYQVSLGCLSILVVPGLYSCLLVAQGLWLSGSLDLVVLCSCVYSCLSVRLPSAGPHVAFWIYLPGSGSLVLLVGEVVHGICAFIHTFCTSMLWVGL